MRPQVGCGDTNAAGRRLAEEEECAILTIFLGCLRSMMEIAGNYRSGATKFEAVRSLRLREGMMRCTLG